MQLRIDVLGPNNIVIDRHIVTTDEIPDDTYQVDSYCESSTMLIGPFPVTVRIRRIM